MGISESKKKIVIDNYFKKECDVNTSIKEAFIKGFELGLKKAPVNPQPKWIPVSERLPDEEGFYLVSVGAPYKTIRVFEFKPCVMSENQSLWKDNYDCYCFNWFVEAWMPLPESYRAERSEEE